MASKLSPAGVTRDKRKRTPKPVEVLSITEPVLTVTTPEPVSKKAKTSTEKNKESDEEPPVEQTQSSAHKTGRLRRRDFELTEAIEAGAMEESEEFDESEDANESQEWEDIEEGVSKKINRKKKDVSSSQASTPAARRRLSRKAKLEQTRELVWSFYSRIF